MSGKQTKRCRKFQSNHQFYNNLSFPSFRSGYVGAPHAPEPTFSLDSQHFRRLQEPQPGVTGYMATAHPIYPSEQPWPNHEKPRHTQTKSNWKPHENPPPQTPRHSTWPPEAPGRPALPPPRRRQSPLRAAAGRRRWSSLSRWGSVPRRRAVVLRILLHYTSPKITKERKQIPTCIPCFQFWGNLFKIWLHISHQTSMPYVCHFLRVLKTNWSPVWSRRTSPRKEVPLRSEAWKAPRLPSCREVQKPQVFC